MAARLRDRDSPDGPPTTLIYQRGSQASTTYRGDKRAALAALGIAVGLLALSAIRTVALHWGAPSIPAGLAFASLAGLPPLALPSVRAQLAGFPQSRSLGLGTGLGITFLVPGLALRAWGAPQLFPDPSSLTTWVPAITAVAISEEVALRALIQPAARAAWGATPAIVFTALVFAVLHLPLYGPAALPLDLGVGLLIGLLRERTGSVAACATAHAIADIGSWFLP